MGIRIRHYKRRRRDKKPSVYRVMQDGDGVSGTVWLDPVLKKKRHQDLKRGILKHELTEIDAWAKGKTNPHTIASRAEPKVTKKLGGERGFWAEIAKRERRVSK